MRKERICAVSMWCGGPGRFDTVFVKDYPEAQTIQSGLSVAHVRLFFSFSFRQQMHSCALLTNFSYKGTASHSDTGMWVVYQEEEPQFRIVPLTHILRAVHLIPIYNDQVENDPLPSETLDKYSTFYVNKYVDHHSFEIAA